MQIWIDADACPNDIKEILYRAAKKRQVLVTLVANQSIYMPKSEFITQVLAPQGMNMADRKIVELASPGDLVVTADIPLAADLVAKGVQALNPRGELYTADNVGERLAMRNLVDDMRGGGRIMRGPSGITLRDRQAFANQLDRWLSAAKK
ncbi:MAG TPA: YaiI/YqxD family protein [Pirellulales bacterium]